MDESKLRKIPVPTLILGLFLADFILAIWLLVSQPRGDQASLTVAVLILGVLGLLLHNRLSLRLREADSALDQGEAYIERVADLTLDIQAIIDTSTQRYVYVNQALETVLGYSPEEFKEGGLAFFQELVHPDDRRLVKQQWERLLDRSRKPPAAREEEVVQEEVFRVRNKWNEHRWFRSRRVIFSRHADGSPWEVLTVLQDITEQRAYEAALVHAHEFESLGLLARRLAHDLNNILMGIQGYTELGASVEDPAELKEHLRRIGLEAERASKLCRQLLAYAGRGRIHLQRHQLNDSIREGLPLVESILPENVHLVLDLESDLPKVNADPNQIRYALLNLVVSGMEALGNQQGDITIRTSLRHMGGEADPQSHGLVGDFVYLEVRDSGPGMSEETLDGLYDPFFSTKYPGRGLGMLTIQGLAREHHGALHVESQPGRGSAFRLYLPVAEREAEVDAGDEGTPTSAGSGAVLLVDDEPTIRSILRQGLEQAGYPVIEAVDGVDGFGSFVRHRSAIGLVLLDLTMPRMGGDEVFEEIRKIAPEVPVILMSGYSQAEATEALRGKGLAGFLSKPCSVKDALAVVGRILAPPRKA